MSNFSAQYYRPLHVHCRSVKHIYGITMYLQIVYPFAIYFPILRMILLLLFTLKQNSLRCHVLPGLSFHLVGQRRGEFPPWWHGGKWHMPQPKLPSPRPSSFAYGVFFVSHIECLEFSRRSKGKVKNTHAQHWLLWLSTFFWRVPTVINVNVYGELIVYIYRYGLY
jgi:hypothetical protein